MREMLEMKWDPPLLKLRKRTLRYDKEQYMNPNETKITKTGRRAKSLVVAPISATARQDSIKEGFQRVPSSFLLQLLAVN